MRRYLGHFQNNSAFVYMDPSSRAHPYCAVQKGVSVTPFHVDFAGGSCQSPKGLKAWKIWAFVPWEK